MAKIALTINGSYHDIYQSPQKFYPLTLTRVFLRPGHRIYDKEHY